MLDDTKSTEGFKQRTIKSHQNLSRGGNKGVIQKTE